MSAREPELIHAHKSSLVSQWCSARLTWESKDKNCLWGPWVLLMASLWCFPQSLFVNYFCPGSRRIICPLSDDTSILSHNLPWRNTSSILQIKSLKLSMGSGWDASQHHPVIGSIFLWKIYQQSKPLVYSKVVFMGFRAPDRSWGLQDHRWQSKHGQRQRGVNYQLCHCCSQRAAGGVATNLTCPAPHTPSSHLLFSPQLQCRGSRGFLHAWEPRPGLTI